MTIFEAIIMGVVEGITEFLPISSTGHLILAGKLLGLPDTDFQKSFEIIIQLGAILSVVVLYWRKLFVSFEIQKKIAAAFLPTAVVGLVLYKVIKTYLLSSAEVVVAALFIGGVLIIVFEKWQEKRTKENLIGDISDMSWKQAAIIGLCQSVAVIPGVSRSAATIIGGLGLGIKREAIVEFSFLLAVPTMLAATILDLSKSAYSFSATDAVALAVGFLVSFVVALAVIKLFLGFVQKYTFTSFGIYRIVLAVLFFAFLL